MPRKNKKRAATAAGGAVNGTDAPVDSGEEANGGAIPPAHSVAAANGGEPAAEMESDGDEKEANSLVVGDQADTGEENSNPPPPTRELNGRARAAESGSEDGRDSSPERDGEAAKLKALNSMLVREAVESREKAAALAAQVEALSAASSGAGVEMEVLRVALEGPRLAATKEEEALRARLAAAEESLDAAEARAAREAEARGEAEARLSEAVAEKRRVEELLRAKEAEAAAACEKAAGFESAVAGLQGKCSELRAERAELDKQLGELKLSAQHIRAENAELEGRFRDFKDSSGTYKQEMQEKLDGRLRELEVLRSEKAELEAKLQGLQKQLSAAMARSCRLESELQANKKDVAVAKIEVEKLRSKVAEDGKKHSAVAAQADGLRTEVSKMMTMKEEAEAAFSAEKAKLEKELTALKRKFDMVQANKDAALGMVQKKDAEVAKLNAELQRLRDSVAELGALSEKLSTNSSSLQDEKDEVLKALDEQREEGGKLRLRIGEIESFNSEKDRQIMALKAEVEDKDGKIDDLNTELEQLQLEVAEAQQRGSSRVWMWLCPATTTVVAAASFVYAARSR